MIFYVSPKGNDSWSGRIPKAETDGVDGPLATLQGAQKAIRRLKADGPLQQPVKVQLGGGTYQMTEPLRLSPGDSGTQQYPITWCACPGEESVLSGGQTITGWKPWRDGILRAELPEVKAGLWWFRQLFYKGQRMRRARWPKYDHQEPLYGGWAFVQDIVQEDETVPPSAFTFDPAAFPAQWEKPDSGEVFIITGKSWVNDIIPIKTVDYLANTIHLQRAAEPSTSKLFGTTQIVPGNRFYVENILENLTEPGEWCLDKDTGTIYFRPPDDDFVPDAVTAPVADSLIRMTGRPDRPVEYVRIQGLTFTQTQVDFPNSKIFYKTPNASQALYMENTSDCCIEDNNFYAVGGDAIRLQGDNTRDVIKGNEIAFAGAYGIFIGNFQKGFAWHCTQSGDVPSPPEWHQNIEDRLPTVLAWPESKGHQITDNHIHHIGVYEKHAGGIYLFGIIGSDITIAHNLIHNIPRFGIGLLSGFGQVTVEYNDLHNISEETCDTGGICSNRWYIWEGDEELAKGCIVRFNRIRDVIGCGAYGTKQEPGGTDHAGGRLWAPYYGWAIYFDNAPMNTKVYGNICARNTLGGIMISHYGRDVTVENNIFVDSSRSQLFLFFVGAMSGIRFRRNIFSYSQRDTDLMRSNIVEGADVTGMLEEFDYNIYCPPSDRGLTFSGTIAEAAIRTGVNAVDSRLTLEKWREMGFDTHSILADPEFIDPTNDDYRLKPSSPALSLGFQQIDVNQIGPRCRHQDEKGK